MHGGLIENITLNSDVIVTKLELKLCAYVLHYCQHSCLMQQAKQAGQSCCSRLNLAVSRRIVWLQVRQE